MVADSYHGPSFPPAKGRKSHLYRIRHLHDLLHHGDTTDAAHAAADYPVAASLVDGAAPRDADEVCARRDGATHGPGS